MLVEPLIQYESMLIKDLWPIMMKSYSLLEFKTAGAHPLPISDKYNTDFIQIVSILLVRVYAHRASASVSASGPIGIHCDARVDAWNGSGTDFQASQCIPMGPDADTDADAQCAHSLKSQTILFVTA